MIIFCLEELKDSTVFSESYNNPDLSLIKDNPNNCSSMFPLIQLNKTHAFQVSFLNYIFLSLHLHMQDDEKYI